MVISIFPRSPRKKHGIMYIWEVAGLQTTGKYDLAPLGGGRNLEQF
jgi:hypothetical protein